MTRNAEDYKPTKAEQEALAKVQAQEKVRGVARADAFIRATQGHVGEKPGVQAVYGHGKRGEK